MSYAHRYLRPLALLFGGIAVAAPSPSPVRVGDVSPGRVPPPDFIAGSVKVRISAARIHSCDFRPGSPALLRFTASVIIKNNHVAVILLPTGARDGLTFSRLEASGANGVPCTTKAVNAPSAEIKTVEYLEVDGERVFRLASDYDISIPKPGIYRAVVSVGFAKDFKAMTRPSFISSEPFEFEVRENTPVVTP